MKDIITLILVFSVVFFMPLFFWARGIIKSNKSDLVAGAIIILIASVLLFITGAQKIFCILLIMLSVETIVTGCFAKSDCPLSKKDRIVVATVLFIIPAFLLLPAI